MRVTTCEGLGRFGHLSWVLEKLEIVKIPEVINDILNAIYALSDSLENCIEKDSKVVPGISGLVVNRRPSLWQFLWENVVLLGL